MTADNKARIGDIWRDGGETGNALAAYAEAAQFYEKALEANTAGAETADFIRQRAAAAAAAAAALQ